MSLSVGSPTSNSFAKLEIPFAFTLSSISTNLPFFKSSSVYPKVFISSLATPYDSGWTEVLSKASLLSITLKNPAHCS